MHISNASNQVVQEFTLKREHDILYVRFIRFQNANGIIDSVHSRQLDDHNNPIMEDEFDYKPRNITHVLTLETRQQIEEAAGELWDTYWEGLENIRVGKEWAKWSKQNSLGGK